MPYGPGIYDHLATYVHEQTGADCVFVCVLKEGKSGFAVQMNPAVGSIKSLAAVLRFVADQMEKEGTN